MILTHKYNVCRLQLHRLHSQIYIAILRLLIDCPSYMKGREVQRYRTVWFHEPKRCRCLVGQAWEASILVSERLTGSCVCGCACVCDCVCMCLCSTVSMLVFGGVCVLASSAFTLLFRAELRRRKAEEEHRHLHEPHEPLPVTTSAHLDQTGIWEP